MEENYFVIIIRNNLFYMSAQPQVQINGTYLRRIDKHLA